MPGPTYKGKTTRKKVKRKPAPSGFANAREAGMYGGSEKEQRRKAAKVERSLRTARRTSAVDRYRRLGPDRVSAREEAIALRTMAREATTPEEWRKLQEESATGFALSELEKGIEARRAAETPKSPDKGDGGSFVGDALGVLMEVDRFARKVEPGMAAYEAAKDIPSLTSLGAFQAPAALDFSRVTGIENKNKNLQEDIDQASLLAGAGAAAGLARQAARRGAQALGPRIGKVVGEVAEEGAKKGAQGGGSGIRGATSRAGQATRTKVKRVTEPVTKSKPAQTAKQTTQKVADKTPAPIKAAATESGKGVRAVGGHLGRRKFAYAAGPGALGVYGAAKTGDPGKLVTAPIDTIAGVTDALLLSGPDSTLDTLATTAEATAASLKGATEIPLNIGLSAYRAYRDFVPDVPGQPAALGRGEFTGEEIQAPTKRMVQAQLEGLKEYADTLTSGDRKRIAEAARNEYGVFPVASALPLGARALSTPYREARTRLRQRAAEKRGAPTIEDPRDSKQVEIGADPNERPVSDKAWRNKQRKDVARRASRAQVSSDAEILAAEGTTSLNILRRKDPGITVNARKASSRLPEMEFVSQRKNADGQVVAEKVLTVKAGDAVTYFSNRGIPFDNPAAARSRVDASLEKALRDAQARDKEGVRIQLTKAPPEAILSYIDQNLDALLTNKNFREAVEKARRVQAPEELGGLSYSERARYLPIARDRENPLDLPEEKVHPLAQELTGATTRAEARADWELGPKKSKLRQEAIRRAKVVTSIRGKIARREEKNPDDPGLADLELELESAINARREINTAVFYSKSRTDYTPEMLKAYEDEVKAVIAEEGLVEPGQTARANVLENATRQPTSSATGAQISSLGRMAADRMEMGKVVDKGYEDMSFEAFLERSVREPIKKRWIFGMWRNFFDDYSLKFDGGVEFTGTKINELVGDGRLNLNDYALAPAQLYSRVYRGRTRDTDPDLTDDERIALADDLANIEELLKRRTGAMDSNRKYRIVPRQALEEMMSQTGGAGKFVRSVGKLNRAQSMALLLTSPAWLSIQFIAETLQGAAARSWTGIPTPVSIYKVYNGKGARAVREMMKNKDEQVYNFIAAAGEAPAMGTSQVGAKANLADGDISRAADALDVMNMAGLKRSLAIPMTALGTIDRWKASLIRRGVAADYVDKRLNGFQANLKSLLGVEEKIFKQLRGKSLDEQIRFFASNHKLRNEMAQYMEDVLGEWNALTSMERVPAPIMMFYPFIRMSLRVTLWGFPKRHPVKYAILTTLGATNAEQLRDLLEGPQQDSEGGEPSIFAGFAQPAIYGAESTSPDNPYGVSQTLPLQRAVPGANAILEGVFGGNPLMAPLRIMQPLIGMAVTGMTGVQEYGDQVDKDLNDRVANFVHSLLSIPAPLRLLDQLDARNVPILGEFMNRNESPDGSLPTKVGERSAVEQLLPFMPQSLRTTRMQSQLTDLFRRMENMPTESKRDDIASRYSRARDAFNNNRTPETERDLREIALEIKSATAAARSGERAKDQIAKIALQYDLPELSRRNLEDFGNAQQLMTGRRQSIINFWLSARKGQPPESVDTAADLYAWQLIVPKRPRIKRGGRIVGIADNSGGSADNYFQQIRRR